MKKGYNIIYVGVFIITIIVFTVSTREYTKFEWSLSILLIIMTAIFLYLNRRR